MHLVRCESFEKFYKRLSTKEGFFESGRFTKKTLIAYSYQKIIPKNEIIYFHPFSVFFVFWFCSKISFSTFKQKTLQEIAPSDQSQFDAIFNSTFMTLGRPGYSPPHITRNGRPTKCKKSPCLEVWNHRIHGTIVKYTHPMDPRSQRVYFPSIHGNLRGTPPNATPPLK